MSIDIPLCIPNPDSTAIASYVSSVADIGLIANEANTRKLARDIVSFMRVQGWQPTAGPVIQYQRPVVPAESFTPVQGENWAQVISAEDARSLSWEDYDAIGQAPEVSEG
ncbi:hypothetical protein FAGAP_11643 [Fusarium agapanthi]|uniref:Uncharacterized protein n=1 Tax=Fusarium agapanthi TaxID=1803897 RepID=A0A9P5B5B2_9HYPO|nr:hypothetical protein FAGAP_11643 [Fusarium agapanthi]